MKTLLTSLIAIALAANCALALQPEETLPQLKVSDNGRFLVTEASKSFFWLGDTAWSLFQRLNREEADRYLKDRAAKNFNVIQAVALWHSTEGNAYGHFPFADGDPVHPSVQDGPANDYWDHVDYIVNRANSLGLYVGFLPCWGSFWHNPIRNGKPLFNPQNAEAYGLWLGRRYKNKGIIWILGGDNVIEHDVHKAVIRAMARGLRQGDGGTHLITFHPRGGRGSAEVLHNEPWLDFNMRQNGHVPEFTGRYEKTHADYDRKPAKPVLDGEPLYEDHPVSFKHKLLGHSIAADVRRALYWNLFSGACGHTYGHHSVWSMHVPGDGRDDIMLMPWHEALDQPGAKQMQYGRRLMESRPFLSRIPDDSVIVPSQVPTSVPGAGTRRFVATRDINGSYAMVYAPVGRPFSVQMDKITGSKVKAWWFNPRDGQTQPIGEFPNTGTRQFLSPNPGEHMDWVLVLDDASKNYPPPGQSNFAGAEDWPDG
jgi:hypothetical protein